MVAFFIALLIALALLFTQVLTKFDRESNKEPLKKELWNPGETEQKIDHRMMLACPKAVYKLFNKLGYTHLDYESIWLLCLNDALRLTSKPIVVGIGEKFSIELSCSKILREVILSGETRFIVVHNHPNGVTKQSKEDEIFAKNLKKAADTVKLSLEDSVVVSEFGASSIRHTSPEIWGQASEK